MPCLNFHRCALLDEIKKEWQNGVHSLQMYENMMWVYLATCRAWKVSERKVFFFFWWISQFLCYCLTVLSRHGILLFTPLIWTRWVTAAEHKDYHGPFVFYVLLPCKILTAPTVKIFTMLSSLPRVAHDLELPKRGCWGAKQVIC